MPVFPVKTPLLPAILLSLHFSSLPLSAFEIIAHRGASHDAPENTLASLKLGWEQGADVTVTATYPYSISLLGVPLKNGLLKSTTTERVE